MYFSPEIGVRSYSDATCYKSYKKASSPTCSLEYENQAKPFGGRLKKSLSYE